MKNQDNFVPMIQVLFIGLKLTDHIDWEWWWVLSPTIAGLAIVLVVSSVGVYYDKK